MRAAPSPARPRSRLAAHDGLTASVAGATSGIDARCANARPREAARSRGATAREPWQRSGSSAKLADPQRASRVAGTFPFAGRTAAGARLEACEPIVSLTSRTPWPVRDARFFRGGPAFTPEADRGSGAASLRGAPPASLRRHRRWRAPQHPRRTRRGWTGWRCGSSPSRQLPPRRAPARSWP